jgi:transcriptional regulator of acetoin/glycerol metabolism
MIRTACLMLDDNETTLRMHHLSEEALNELSAKPAAPASSIIEIAGNSLREKSDAMIAAAVTQAGGNIAAAARNLGISRNTLYRRLSASQSTH